MMEGFSPLSRRVIAVGLAILAVLSLVSFVIQPLIAINLDSYEHLQDARFRLARLEAMRDAPPPPEAGTVPADFTFSGRTREDAAGQLLTLMDGLAKETGNTVETAALASGDNSARVTVDFVLAGQEAQVLTFIHRLESGRPIVRLVGWRLAGPDTGSGPTRLEARATAVWRRQP